jgi:PKD repeat protein
MDREYGLPPLTVNFDNQSTTNTQHTTHNTNLWTFGDGSNSNQENPTHIYLDSSVFYPQLIVENTYACKDSVSHSVYVIYAKVDIALIEVTSSIDGAYARFSCVIENRGQQKIKQMDLSANYNGGQPIQEQWSGELLPGQKTTYVFQAKVKVQGNPAYYCITATPITDIDDEYPADNTLCKEYEAKLWVGSIYPNPATEFINIDMVLPVNQEIQLQLTNSSGLQIQSTTTKGQRGLNQLKINTTNLSAGLYHLRITSGNEEAVRAFIIR